MAAKGGDMTNKLNMMHRCIYVQKYLRRFVKNDKKAITFIISHD